MRQLERGASAFVNKPFGTENLLAVVEKVLREQAQPPAQGRT